MATLCKLCDKKIGFFDASYSPAEVTICEDCYRLYVKVLDSVSDINIFNANLSEFQNTFSGKEGLGKITGTNDIKALYL